MVKYKQKLVPEVVADFSNYSVPELRAKVKAFYAARFQGKSVVNEHLKITISFTSLGKNKTAQGGAMYSKKAAAMLVLDKLVRYARYNNFGTRKDTDPASIVGYLNFIGKFKLNGRIEYVRIAIAQRKDGRFYYNQEVNAIKNPPSSVR
jgi:hypothetical protein